MANLKERVRPKTWLEMAQYFWPNEFMSIKETVKVKSLPGEIKEVKTTVDKGKHQSYMDAKQEALRLHYLILLNEYGGSLTTTKETMFEDDAFITQVYI